MVIFQPAILVFRGGMIFLPWMKTFPTETVYSRLLETNLTGGASFPHLVQIWIHKSTKSRFDPWLRWKSRGSISFVHTQGRRSPEPRKRLKLKCKVRWNMMKRDQAEYILSEIIAFVLMIILNEKLLSAIASPSLWSKTVGHLYAGSSGNAC